MVRGILNKPTGNLTQADWEKVTKPIKIISLNCTELEDLAKLVNLTALDLDAEITDEGWQGLAKLQNLERFTMAYTKITDVGLKEIAKMQNLKKIRFMGSQITDEGIAELRKALPNCRIFGVVNRPEGYKSV